MVMQLTNAEHPCLLVFVPEADILDILCDYQFVFPALNFILHTMLDAACDVPRVHYKSMKCDVSFSQHNVFRLGGHLSYMFKNFLLA